MSAASNMTDSSFSEDVVILFQRELIVSCQAELAGFVDPTFATALMARCAQDGGARGVRVSTPAHVLAARSSTSLPVIGLHKVAGVSRKIITPRLDLAVALAEAGSSVIATEFAADTGRDKAQFLREIQVATGLPIMADVSTWDEGIRAWEAGATFVGTTLSGYAKGSTAIDEPPDLDLVFQLAQRGVRVIAEGRYATPLDVTRAFDAGAHSVVVGSAITDPVKTTRSLVRAARSADDERRASSGAAPGA